MKRSFIMVEIVGSSASETLVRSTYEIVYMISATGIMRSQRSAFIRSVQSPWGTNASTASFRTVTPVIIGRAHERVQRLSWEAELNRHSEGDSNRICKIGIEDSGGKKI